MKTWLIIGCFVVLGYGCRKIDETEDMSTSNSTDSADTDTYMDTDTDADTDTDTDTDTDVDTDTDADTDTACVDVTPCGGDVVGAWDVTSSCLTVSGELDITRLGLYDCVPTISGELAIEGTWTASSDGTFSDSTATAGNVQIYLPCECRIFDHSCAGPCDRLDVVFSYFGYSSFNCEEDPSDVHEKCYCGGACHCTAVVDQVGEMGVVARDPKTHGNYAAEGSTIIVTDTDPYSEEPEYSYCASQTLLTMTPKSTSSSGTLTGAAELRRQ